VHELVMVKAVPPAVRRRMWQLAIGNELQITPELYQIFRTNARDKASRFKQREMQERLDRKERNASGENLSQAGYVVFLLETYGARRLIRHARM
jgi:hypothetical protein